MKKIIFVSLIIIIILIGATLIYQYYWAPKINMENEIESVFTINGQKVEQSQFEEMKSGLDIPKEYKYTSSIEGIPANPASGNLGTPAGTEVVYEATDKKTGKKYLYIEIGYPNKQIFEIREGE